MNVCTGYTWDISAQFLDLSKSIMTRNSFLYQSHVQTYVKCCLQTMVSRGLGSYHCLYMQRISAACTGPIYTPWVRWPALDLGKFLWWKEKMVIRTASIVLHFVDGRGIMMDWWINTLNASQPSARNLLKHHWWVCPCSIWYNSMIGMRKLSGCKCRNMWQLIGGNKMVD